MLRIAEVSYKLNLTDQAFDAILICERLISKKDIYMVNMLKGKCYDRNRQYKEASEQYAKALKSCEEHKSYDLNLSIVGNMEFRLGWSMIRAKQ